MRTTGILVGLVLIVFVIGFSSIAGGVKPGGSGSGPSFTLTQLLRADGNSEPAVTIGSNHVMAISGLSWTGFGTNVWKGAFGATPTYQGVIDANLGVNVFGGGDADLDIGSTGALHATTLIFLVNPAFTAAKVGVSAITCPNADTSNNFASCKSQIIDMTQADRQWVTSDGPTVYISYHDSGSSTLIHVQRSDDDGMTWHKVGDPVTGQDGITGMATFNNDQGPIVADHFSGNVYAIYAPGTAGLQKGTTATFNHIVVARSTNKGLTWTANLVYTAPVFTALNNVFPALAADPKDGALYAVWSDAHTVWYSKSTDQASHWTPAVAVNSGDAKTAVFPWVAAYNGIVDIVYYGTTADSKDDPAAVWNTYFAQPTSGGFAQTKVTSAPNHVGVICTQGIACPSGTRNLLDLFEVSIDPMNGKAAIVYTDDTLTQTDSGAPLPQIVLATQN